MTITRLRQTGFELQNLAYEMNIVNATPTISTVQVKTGGYSASLGGSNARHVGYVITSTTQVRTGCHVYTNPGSNLDLIGFHSGVTTGLRLQVTTTGLRLVTGASTVLATCIEPKFTGTGPWVHVSVDVRVHASLGWIRVYVDGVQVMNYSGATNAAIASIDRVVYGQFASAGLGTYYIDDIVLDDTTSEATPSFTPDARFNYVLPQGNGNSSQWTGSDADSVNNFLLVDDVPSDEDATYVVADIAALKDTYAMDSITLPTGWSITAIIPTAIAKKDNAGSAIQLSMVTRLGVNENTGALNSLGTSYGMVWDRQTTKPGGGAWVQADLDSMEAGMVTG